MSVDPWIRLSIVRLDIAIPDALLDSLAKSICCVRFALSSFCSFRHGRERCAPKEPETDLQSLRAKSGYTAKL